MRRIAHATRNRKASGADRCARVVRDLPARTFRRPSPRGRRRREDPEEAPEERRRGGAAPRAAFAAVLAERGSKIRAAATPFEGARNRLEARSGDRGGA